MSNIKGGGSDADKKAQFTKAVDQYRLLVVADRIYLLYHLPQQRRLFSAVVGGFCQ